MGIGSTIRDVLSHWLTRWLAGGLLVALAVLGVVLYEKYTPALYVPVPASFNGDSSALERTVIVPTLEAPLPPGRNAVWCGAFQLAWRRLRDDVIGEPVKLQKADTLAAQLNATRFRDADLPPGAFYAEAGPAENHIAEKVRADMAAEFPGVAVPVFDLGTRDVLAYAYLTAGITFAVPFFDRNDGAVFVDSAGRKTRVSSFGFFQGGSPVNERLAGQMEILYAKPGDETGGGGVAEYALDLCRSSQPCQLILARIERRATLAEMLAYLKLRIASWEPADQDRKVRSRDRLAVPNLSWMISHRFREVSGADRRFGNEGWRECWLTAAWQQIEFRLDKGGAAVAPDSDALASGQPRRFHFTRPFLIVMQRRDAERPFLVIWVDNAELLCEMPK